MSDRPALRVGEQARRRAGAARSQSAGEHRRTLHDGNRDGNRCRRARSRL